MWLLSEVANTLQDKLNSSELTFKVTANEQIWRGYELLSADDIDYLPVVVRTLPVPPVTDFYRTRALGYLVTLKGKMEHEGIVERLINDLREFSVDGDKWYLSNFVVEDTGNARDGRALTKEFRASFRLSIYVPFFLTGADCSVKVDGVEIPFIRISSVHDKALIPNKAYNLENYNDINVGEELIFNIPIVDNEKVLELFGSVKDNSYNREFEVTVDYKVLEKTNRLVLTGGSDIITNDTSGMTFNAVFTKALERTSISINGIGIDVFGFTPSASITPNPLNKGGITRVRSESSTITYQMQLINDKSELISDIVEETFKHTNKKFVIAWEFNDRVIQTECIVQIGSVPSSENPNALIQVVFTAGYFYGN